jgi:hypothetical protein
MADNSDNIPPSSNFTVGHLTNSFDPNGTFGRPQDTSQEDGASAASDSNTFQGAQTAEDGGTNASRQTEKPDMLVEAERFRKEVAQDFRVALPTAAAVDPSELSETALAAVLDCIVKEYSNFESMNDEDLTRSMISRPETLKNPVQQRCFRYRRGQDGQWLTDLTELCLVAAIVAVCEIPPTEKTYQAIFRRFKDLRNQDLEAR